MKSKLRLRRSPDFARVYSARTGKGGKLMVLHSRPNSVGHARVGFSVSSKLGGAVVRNRVRRRLRAAATQVIHPGTLALDIVVVARAPAITASVDELMAELRQLLGAVTAGSQV